MTAKPTISAHVLRLKRGDELVAFNGRGRRAARPCGAPSRAATRSSRSARPSPHSQSRRWRLRSCSPSRKRRRWISWSRRRRSSASAIFCQSIRTTASSSSTRSAASGVWSTGTASREAPASNAAAIGRRRSQHRNRCPRASHGFALTRARCSRSIRNRRCDWPTCLLPPPLLSPSARRAGFGTTDLAALDAAGFRRVGLGQRVLRTETAAIAACAAAQALWGDF